MPVGVSFVLKIKVGRVRRGITNFQSCFKLKSIEVFFSIPNQGMELKSIEVFFSTPNQGSLNNCPILWNSVMCPSGSIYRIWKGLLRLILSLVVYNIENPVYSTRLKSQSMWLCSDYGVSSVAHLVTSGHLLLHATPVQLACRQGKGRRWWVLSGPWLTQAFQLSAFILDQSAEILKLPVVLQGSSNHSKLTKMLESCQLKTALGICFYI